MNIKGLKKAFILSPCNFIKFHFNWWLGKVKHKDNSRLAQTARYSCYQAYRTEVIAQFKKRYKREIAALVSRIDEENSKLPHNSGEKVWVCWLQGIEDAPDIVKICYKSILRCFSDREVVLITDKNFSNYISLPDYILEKYRKGLIAPALFSDLIRLNLLIDHGGIWIDSTILWTSDGVPEYMLNSELFMPRLVFYDAWNCASQTENFFIIARQNSKLLIFTRDLLYEYWKKQDFTVDYLIFYDFFEIAIECYPEEWRKMVPFSRSNCLMLSDYADVEYNQQLYAELTSRSPFQKLSWRLSQNGSGGGT